MDQEQEIVKECIAEHEECYDIKIPEALKKEFLECNWEEYRELVSDQLADQSEDTWLEHVREQAEDMIAQDAPTGTEPFITIFEGESVKDAEQRIAKTEQQDEEYESKFDADMQANRDLVEDAI